MAAAVPHPVRSNMGRTLKLKLDDKQWNINGVASRPKAALWTNDDGKGYYSKIGAGSFALGVVLLSANSFTATCSRPAIRLKAFAEYAQSAG